MTTSLTAATTRAPPDQQQPNGSLWLGVLDGHQPSRNLIQGGCLLFRIRENSAFDSGYSHKCQAAFSCVLFYHINVIKQRTSNFFFSAPDAEITNQFSVYHPNLEGIIATARTAEIRHVTTPKAIAASMERAATIPAIADPIGIPT